MHSLERGHVFTHAGNFQHAGARMPRGSYDPNGGCGQPAAEPGGTSPASGKQFGRDRDIGGEQAVDIGERGRRGDCVDHVLGARVGRRRWPEQRGEGLAVAA